MNPDEVDRTTALDSIRGQLGRRYPLPTWNREVTEDAIRHFALGIGDDNPLWWNREYAEASPHCGVVAPPCYLYSHIRAPLLRPGAEANPGEALLPGVPAMVARESWRWRRPVRAGEQIRAEACLLDVEVGDSGGRSVTLLERVYLMCKSGEIVAELDRAVEQHDADAMRSRNARLDRAPVQYTAAERTKFELQYESEAEARRGSRPRHAAEVKAGDRLGPILKGPLTLTSVVGFVLGTGSAFLPANRMLRSFERLHPGAAMVQPGSGMLDTVEAAHWDVGFAQAVGMPAPYDLGIDRTSWFSHLLTDWMGDHGFLAELHTQMLQPNLLGDVSWLSGRIVEVDVASGSAGVALECRNQLGEITAIGSAHVKLPMTADAAH